MAGAIIRALRLRFLRRFRLGRPVEGDRLANERLERGLVNVFSFVDVDRAAHVSVETRVEETAWILQRRALGEGNFTMDLYVSPVQMIPSCDHVGVPGF